MAWTAIVARPSCAKELYFCLYGHSPLSPHFVRRFTPESAFADSLERFSDSRSIIVKTALNAAGRERLFTLLILGSREANRRHPAITRRNQRRNSPSFTWSLPRCPIGAALRRRVGARNKPSHIA